ncbi:MAG: tetratricopeptide repeat protein [Spirochaetota bacterium]
MSHIKKFSYPNTSKRWLVLLALFITFFVTAFIITEIIIDLKQYLPYYPVIQTIMIFSIIALFAGNIAGRLLLSAIKNYRIITIASAILFTVFSIFFFTGKIFKPELFSTINIYVADKYYIIPLSVIPFFLSGILNSYYLKISSGDFIDEKNLLSSYIIFLPVALGTGFFTAYIILFYTHAGLFSHSLLAVIALTLPVILFFIKIPYNPEQLYAQNFYEDEAVADSPVVQRDDLFFTYINFSYIMVYLVLGFVLFVKFYSHTYYNVLLYIITTLFLLPAGILLGKKKKASFWHVYSEMLYPVFFLLYLSTLYMFSGKACVYTGLAFSAIPALIFGFSLEQTVKNITHKYDHDKRFKVLNFSMLILPVPILISLSTVNFTYLLFFAILYTAALFNLLIPGIFLFNTKINPVNKILYFIFALVFLPSIMLIHLYFKIPLNNNYFAPKVENYELIRNTNFTEPYIIDKGEVLMFNTPVFFLSDNYIRNFKRAAATTVFFASQEGKTLILDSNLKFYRNPLYSFFTNSVYIDTLTDKNVDYNRIPFSGKQQYEPENEHLFEYLTTSDNNFDFIIDAPNILDQNFHFNRFSNLYYKTVKKIINNKGVYASIFDLQYMSKEMLSYAFSNLKQNFKHHVVFLFSNILLLVSSDEADALKINPDSITGIKSIISNEKKYGSLFYQDIHPLNNIIFTDIENLILFYPKALEENPIKYTPVQIGAISETFKEYYILYEPDWFNQLLFDDKKFGKFNADLKSAYTRNSQVLKLLKQTEYAESINAYENETAYLFELKKMSSYRPELRTYIDSILSYKENYYFDEAIRLEKEKNWEDATTLYKAIITINKNNFDANYRLGLLFLTIQNLENASKYLNAALQLDKNHPNVLYQMGVLMFSSNRFKEAITFLEKTESLNEKNAPLYMYLGLSYENINRLDKAKEYFERAIIQDPNDKKLQELLDGVIIKLKPAEDPFFQSERTNMIDDEKDEEFILPVNDKAIRSRLMDDEK